MSGARPPLLPEEPPAASPVVPSFPPNVSEADALLRILAERGDEEAFVSASRVLSGYSDSTLELVAEVARGPASEAPVEEVWHWLAATEQLARALSFADHFSVAGLAARLESQKEAAGEAAERWSRAVRQLRQAQKESSWNARYLRVVEEPLRRLSEGPEPSQLPRLVASTLRSLQRIHSTSAQLREHRMAPLLQRMLKAMVVGAAARLTSPQQVAKPPVGSLETAREEAESLRDGFQAYLENYFVSEAGGPGRAPGGGAAGAGPATPRRAERRPATPERARLLRQDSGQLGWWRATVRHSRELAQTCATICGRVAGLLTLCTQLQSTMSQLRSLDPALLRDVEGFMQLHSGLRGGSLAPADLLEPKRQMETQLKIAEVQDRVSELLGRCKQAGASVPEAPCLEEEFSASSNAEVLVLDATSAPSGHALQESINSLQEDLQEMSSELASFGQWIATKTPRHRFAPGQRGSPAEVEADSMAAKEVARRSTWGREPPSVVPEDVPVIQVQHSIQQRVITRCPSRPRTAQPALLRMSSPQEAPGTGPPSQRPGTSAVVCAAPCRGDQPRTPEPMASAASEAEEAEEELPPGHETEEAHEFVEPSTAPEDPEPDPGDSEEFWPGSSPACLWQVNANT